MGKYQELSDQTRQNFVDAFWTLYQKKDIRKIKVQDVCEMAGYHRSTFYHHFTDLYAVLDYIENTIIQDVIDGADERVFFDFAFSRSVFTRIYGKHEKYLKVLSDDRKNSDFSAKLIRAMQNFCAQKLRYSDDPIENDFIVHYITAGAVNAILHYFQGDFSIPLEKVVYMVSVHSNSGSWQPQYLKNRQND